MDQLSMGQSVLFANVTLTPQGLVSNNKKPLSWQDLAGVTVSDGYIYIWKKQPGNSKPKKWNTLEV